MDRKPSSALTRRFVTPRNAAIAAAITALLIGGGFGAAALAQGPAEDPAPEAQPKSLVPNQPPLPAITTTGVTDLTITLDAATSTDPDGEIVEFAWEFGDGATAAGAAVSHSYAAEGTYTVTLVATDNDGDTGEATVVLTVNAPPSPPAPPAPEPAPAPGYTYGNYPPGATMPNIPGTDQPDTSACASSTGTADANGNPVCA